MRPLLLSSSVLLSYVVISVPLRFDLSAVLGACIVYLHERMNVRKSFCCAAAATVLRCSIHHCKWSAHTHKCLRRSCTTCSFSAIVCASARECKNMHSTRKVICLALHTNCVGPPFTTVFSFRNEFIAIRPAARTRVCVCVRMLVCLWREHSSDILPSHLH